MSHPTLLCSRCLTAFSESCDRDTSLDDGDECLHPGLDDGAVVAQLEDLLPRVRELAPEDAHRAEDAITRAILRTIAAGTCPDPKGTTAMLVAFLSEPRTRWFA